MASKLLLANLRANNGTEYLRLGGYVDEYHYNLCLSMLIDYVPVDSNHKILSGHLEGRVNFTPEYSFIHTNYLNARLNLS